MSFVLALDQGTTSSRAILFGRDGTVHAVAQQEFRQIFPQPGLGRARRHRDLGDAIGRHARGARQGARRARATSRRSASPTSARPRWSGTARPGGRSPTPSSGRTGAPRRCATSCARPATRATVRAQDRARARPLLLRHQAALAARSRRRRPRAGRARRARLRHHRRWLVWNLTGGRVHCTDASNASRTLLFNIHTGEWDDELLRILDVPRALLPEVVASSGICGDDADSAAATVPIAGIAGDQQAALFGQACLAPGLAKNTYGTGCFLLLNTGSERRRLAQQSADDRRVAARRRASTTRSKAACSSAARSCNGCATGCRSSAARRRSRRSPRACPTTAASTSCRRSPASARRTGTPTRAARSSGSPAAPRARTSRAPRSKAIAFQSADVLDAMERDAGITLTELRVDGGAAANNLLMQIPGRHAGRPVVRPQVLETTALGAAYLAGLAVGYWTSTDDIARQLARRPPLRARDAARRARGSCARVGQGGRAREGLGVDARRAARRPLCALLALKRCIYSKLRAYAPF